MANQRMYLRCNSCGAEKFIAKRLGEAFHTVWGRADPDGDWDKWFEVHEWGSCGKGAVGLDIFSLAYEHDPHYDYASGLSEACVTRTAAANIGAATAEKVAAALKETTKC